MEGLVFLGFRVLLRLGFTRFIYRFIGFRVFYCLEVLGFRVRVYLRVSYGFVGLRFFQGLEFFLRLGFARFAYDWVGYRVFQCFEVFSG